MSCGRIFDSRGAATCRFCGRLERQLRAADTNPQHRLEASLTSYPLHAIRGDKDPPVRSSSGSMIPGARAPKTLALDLDPKMP